MEKKDVFTKILAIVGTVLVLIPILAPVLFAVIAFISGRGFRFDYLMPAELFLLVLIGGALLFWAALRARARRKLIGWSIGLAILILFAGQGLAMVTGLASATAEETGWRLAIVFSALVVYILAVIALAIGGILLLRDLFKRSPVNQEN
jgi:predicted membrane protein